MPFFGDDNSPEQDEIQKRAEEAIRKWKESHGGEAPPEEEGLESEGFLDVAKPYKKVALDEASKAGVPSPVVGAADLMIPEGVEYYAGRVANAGKKAGRLMQMAEKMPEAKDAERKVQNYYKSLSNYSKNNEYNDKMLRMPNPKWDKVKPSEGLDYSKFNKPGK